MTRANPPPSSSLAQRVTARRDRDRDVAISRRHRDRRLAPRQDATNDELSPKNAKNWLRNPETLPTMGTTRYRNRLVGFATLALAMLAAAPARAGAWQTNVNYGMSGNPTMDLYTPTTPKPSPGIIVAIHYCSGNAGATHSWFQSLADQYGFYIISPNAGTNCWDASPGRNGSKAAIVAMVNYVITQKNADRTRVFSAGASSGACMTNTLLASYPDVFAGGSALAGVAVGEWPAGDTSCSQCGQNAMSKTAAQWGDVVRMADAGFAGTRPRVQLWHGTSDTTLNYPSQLDAEVAQWTNVFGVSN